MSNSIFNFTFTKNYNAMAAIYIILVITFIAVVEVQPFPGLVVKRETLEAVSDGAEAKVSEDKKKKVKDQVAKESQEQYDAFEVISEEDRVKADQAIMWELLHYAGYTLLGVVCSIIIIICFLLDPRACLVAFSTGSPCCMLCPCYRDLMKYMNPAPLIRAGVNIYIPGVYIEKSGKVREYPPSPEEMDCLFDLISEFCQPD